MEEMIKAAQEAAQNIQQQMEQAQATLDTIRVEGVSGGGLVKVKVTAKGRILNVEIDESLIVPADKGMLKTLSQQHSTTPVTRLMPPAMRKWVRCLADCRCLHGSNCHFNKANGCSDLGPLRFFPS